MTCNNTIVKELLNDCSCYEDECGGTSQNPILDIASPVEGQILRYSEEFKAFINVSMPASSVLRINELHAFAIGAPIFWNGMSWELATIATGCDFIVVATDPLYSWFEVANTGVFNINRPDLIGRIYLDSNSTLTTVATSLQVGFSYSGKIAINISMVSQVTPPTPTPGAGAMTFNDPQNSGLLGIFGGF